MTLAGQGCPRWCKWIAALAMLCACAGGFPLQAQEMVFEIRAVWGGGPTRSFAGTIRLNEGHLELVRNLSVQDDSAAAVVAHKNEILIRPHNPASFGGVDLRVKGKLDSQLQIELTDPTSTTPAQPAQPVQISLRQLLSGREVQPLDAQGSKIALERPLHDRLRMRLNQGHSILRVGETASLVVEGYRTGQAAGDYRLSVRFFEPDNDRPIAQLNHDVVIDDHGSFSSSTLSPITLANKPGVYTVEATLSRRRLINSLMSNPSLPTRRLEFVVAPGDTKLLSAEQSSGPQVDTPWQPVAQIYPAGVSWWDSLGKFRIPTVKSMTPLVAQVARPLSSGEHQRRMVDNRECMVLASGAWQAFPLSIEQPGIPHRVAVQVPADSSQKLVFSVHEPSQASDAPALRLDTGMIVDPGAASATGALTHHLLFWPKQTNSYLMVMNADNHRPATLAEINLEVAQQGLVPSSMASSNSLPANSLPSSSGARRIASLYLDKPLLAENFCANRRVEGSRELDSWLTVWQSCERLAEYTQWSGHDAATVTVATQGGAIYPSQVWPPTHKFDSGTFLSDGSAPDIKDWVELMCCHFDQRGLQLILALDVEGPLPDLERIELEQKSSDPAALAGRYQVDLNGIVAKAVLDSQAPDAPKHTLYNPLEPRVQSVLAKMVTELAVRYGKHPCLAGIQINLSERSHFNFAGDAWGYDADALARFERSADSKLPKDPAERSQVLRGPLRLSFLNDRAAQLSNFYARLAKDVQARCNHARLIINPTKLVAMPPVTENYLLAASQSLAPAELLLASGVDCASLSNIDNLVVLRPEADSPLRSPASRAWSYRLSSDAQLDNLFSEVPSGAIIQQLPTSFRLPDYDKVNPYGNSRTRTWLFPHAMVAGDGARHHLTHRLFQADVQQLTSGGWMVPIGQEDAVRPFLEAYKRFPPVVMHDLTPSGTSATLKVRRVEYAGKTWLQLVNDASWSEQVVVDFKCGTDSAWSAFGGSYQTQTHREAVAAGKPCRASLEIPAYGLAGICIESEIVELADIRSKPPADLAARLELRLNELQKLIDRAGELNQQQTLGLRGGDFEVWEANLPQGWTVSTHPSTTVTQEPELPRSGASCVRLENRSGNNVTAWIQSDRIAIPATGRLALEVWARTLPGPTQPTVRLSLVGRYRDGKRFQRSHEFTSPGGAEPRPVSQANGKPARLPIDWGNRPLVLLVPDLPSDELTELRAGIDVVGQGTIWVDDVRVYGMYLHPEEKVHLSGQMFMARQQMRQGNYALADQMLGSFWSNFLTTYLSSDSSAVAAEVRVNEARVPMRPATPAPSWRKPGSPRLNQWQESLRGRWQR